MDLKSALCTSALILLIAIATPTHGFTIPVRLVNSDASSQTADQPAHQQHNHQQAQVSVQTSSGQLNGLRQPLNLANSSIYKFLGVPYAEPPTGPHRFQLPVELSSDSHKRILDASKFSKTCPQFRHLARLITPLLNVDTEHQISEDCLHLNVYVPTNVGQLDQANENRLEPNKQLPVIVWIPGEGFDFADARQYDGSYLAHKTQSIVVTVQYRVGIFGFLQAPELNITGNMGIHDQLMALSWVRTNIQAFGGDPDRVSLMGRFTGSMAISAIITAPNQELLMRDGKLLFNRVIMLSGVAVHDWAIDPKQHLRPRQVELKALANNYCSPNDLAKRVCLQKMNIEDLLRISDYGWRMTIDNQLVGTLSPAEAIELNRLPGQLESVMIGETGSEGILCLLRHLLDTSKNYAQLIEDNKLTLDDLNEIIRDDLHFYFGYNITRTNPLQSTLESMLEDSVDENDGASSKLRDKYLNVCSSFMVKSHNGRFKRSILSRNQLATTRTDSSKRPIEVFHYELKYKPSFSMAPDYVRTAAHGDDVPLIFGLLYNQPRREVNEADLLMTRKIMALVGNFVHGNNPLLSPQHPAIESSHDGEIISTISMDESETTTGNELAGYSPVLLRRNWSSEAQVHPVEFNENDSNELKLMHARNLTSQAQLTPSDLMVQRGLPKGRLFFLEAPASSDNFFEFKNNPTLMAAPEDSNAAISHSQHLIELHRRQLSRMQQNNVPQSEQLISRRGYQASGQQVQQASMAALNSFSDSSFMTMLLFSSCIVIFTLMSLSLVLCLVIFRNHMSNNVKNPIQQFVNSSTSSCDLCDDTQRTVNLAQDHRSTNKAKRAFGSMFVKLTGSRSDHHDSQQEQHQYQHACLPSVASVSVARESDNTQSSMAQSNQVQQSTCHHQQAA